MYETVLSWRANLPRLSFYILTTVSPFTIRKYTTTKIYNLHTGWSPPPAMIMSTPRLPTPRALSPKKHIVFSVWQKVRALAAPAVLMIMVSEGVFRGHADTRAPAVAALSAAVANTILDPIFMFSLGLGMAGAAGATACAQYFAVVIYGTMLWRGARKGTMAVPFFLSRKSRQEGSRGKGDPSGAVKAWPLLVMVISANAAMLLR